MKQPPLAGTAAPLWRRLAAMVYDSLITIALIMVATAIALPLNDGEAFSPGNLGLQLYLGAVVLGFFILFWHRGGQTLGMRAWKIKLIHRTSTESPSIAQLLLRAVSAVPSLLLGGLGLWWMLLDKQGLAAHDRLSNTRLVVVG